MDVPTKRKKEGLLTYAQRLAELYCSNQSVDKRKSKGQFFTPAQVATFMAQMFNMKKGQIRLLDPGAGVGMLSASFCDRLAGYNSSFMLTIDAYENDARLQPFLKAVLESCKQTLCAKGTKLHYHIYNGDFILQNEVYANHNTLFREKEESLLYDFVISNPPYYKVRKDSLHATIMRDCVCGQPNIYTFFMVTCANMLKPGGEMVFITPRSFCSGLYYKKFRRWFLDNVRLSHVHVFESRNEVFDTDKILQENIILKAERKDGKANRGTMVISTTKNKRFSNMKKLTFSDPELLINNSEESFIKLPCSPIDIAVLNVLDKWPSKLRELGLEISTGPVVPFRAEKYLVLKLATNGKSVPLLWMHNMKGTKTIWPENKNKKPVAIKLTEDSKKLLLPVKNYVLVRRFSAKEEARRLHASVLLQSEFPHEAIGIENHLNYIHKPGGDLSANEAYGISAILNTAIVDNYFRTLNGNTQVNATDIRSLPFPSIKDVKRIGQLVRKNLDPKMEFDLDKSVGVVLGIDENLMEMLHKSRVHYEQNKRRR